MKTVILSSHSKKQFLVFETSKEVDELIDRVRAMSFTPDQANQKELVHSDDLKAEIFSSQTFKSNKDAFRSSAVLQKESEGYNYLGENKGSEIAKSVPQNTENVSGVSIMSGLFLGLCQISFWFVIAFSVFVALKIDLITGVLFAVGGIVGFGVVFILGDILKNIVEINEKSSNT